jgi:dipeptidyl aminopeptidase/acylaminoacyl peptidase
VAGRDLPGQDEQNFLKMLADMYHTLAVQTVSDNGEWVTVWKRYNTSCDTGLIINTGNPAKYAGYRTKATNLASLNNDNLLIWGPDQVELVNPGNMTGVVFKDVKRSAVLEDKSQFLLHYNEKEGNRLEMRDNNGLLLCSLDSVTRYTANESNIVYAVTQNSSEGFVIYSILNNDWHRVYGSDKKIVSVETDSESKGLRIWEQIPGSRFLELTFLDPGTGDCYRLKDLLQSDFNRGSSEVVGKGDTWFLRLEPSPEKEDDPIVDIWYGNDYSLVEKFLRKGKTMYYLWEPEKGMVSRIGNDSLSTAVNLGSDRFFLCYNQYALEKYASVPTPLLVTVYDRLTDSYALLDTVTENLYLSDDGEYGLTRRSGKWFLYHIPSCSKKAVPGAGLEKPWFTDDSKTILFEGKGGLWKYDPISGRMTEAVRFPGYQASIINGNWKSLKEGKGMFDSYQVFLNKPVIIKLFNQQENSTSFVVWNKGRIRVIVPPGPKRIQSIKWNTTCEFFSWIEEDYNLPPRAVFTKTGEKETVLYPVKNDSRSFSSLRQELISYTGSEGSPLNGVLFYPVNYDSTRHYPMVVYIYEIQRSKSNMFLNPSYNEDAGFSIRLMLEKGYFVYLPDILIYGKDGPGLDALNCVHNALDAVAGIPAINKDKIGLIGFSFGGYETDFIATHSDRFATYVSGAGHSDIIKAYHAFNYNFMFPDFLRLETHQYMMKKAFAEDKHLYFRNSPLIFAENVNAPILLWTGKDDQNISSDHTMAFYNALKRNRKEVIALFYNGEKHGLQNPESQQDLTSRIIDWFDYFLKDKTDCEWITKGLK